MAHFPYGFKPVSSNIQPEYGPLLSPLSLPASLVTPQSLPSELESLASLAASVAASNLCDRSKLDLEGIKTEVTTAMGALLTAKARPRQGRRRQVSTARKGLLEVVDRGLTALGEAVTHFRGKCEWVSAQPLPMATTSPEPEVSKHRKKVRAALSPATTPCQCILAASKRLTSREFRQTLQSGAIICTCKTKRA